MNKYKEYLNQAKKRYWGESTEDMLEYLKTEREHLKSLKNVLVKREGIEIHDEMNENCLMYLYTSDDNWEKVLNLLIESCQKDICMIKAIIYEQLENGKLFEEVDE